MSKFTLLVFCLFAIVSIAICARVTRNGESGAQSAERFPSRSSSYQDDEAVALLNIETLTLKKNVMATSRRTHAIPQLRCTGNLCIEKYMPSTVQCYNKGSDGRNVQWKCDAELDTEVAFDDIHVSCEGFDYPGDELVLSGSCGLRYSLKHTNAFHAKQTAAPVHVARNTGTSSPNHHAVTSSTSFVDVFAGIVLTGLFIAAITISIVLACTLGNNRRCKEDAHGGGRGCCPFCTGCCGNEFDDEYDDYHVKGDSGGKRKKYYYYYGLGGTHYSTQPLYPTAPPSSSFTSNHHYHGATGATHATQRNTQTDSGGASANTQSETPSMHVSSGFGSSSVR